MVKAAAIPWVIGALGVGATAASTVEARKTRKGAEDTAEQARLDAAAASVTEKQNLADAETEANEKRKKRAAELATGGRAAQFRTGPLGLSSQANVAKKTLLGG